MMVRKRKRRKEEEGEEEKGEDEEEEEKEEEEEQTDQRLENQDKAFTVKSSRHPADSCVEVAGHLHAPAAFTINATSSANA